MLIQSRYIPIVRSYGGGVLFWVDKVFHCWFINWFYWFDTFKFKLPLRKPPDKILESIGRPQAVSRAPCWAFSPHRTLALCTTLPTSGIVFNWWVAECLTNGAAGGRSCCIYHHSHHSLARPILEKQPEYISPPPPLLLPFPAQLIYITNIF